MTDFIASPEPTVLAIAFIKQHFLDAEVGQKMPADRPDLFIQVTDTGGAGRHDVVMDEVRLTFDVYAKDSSTASRVARDLFGLLWVWPERHTGVYRRRGWSRPAWVPDDVTGQARYVLTATLDFRGERRTL
ncbi:hypothetical protein [Arthrobacter sp. NPDC090010]|uniref:hypothetical protein n=1 Tax=Arthrobacter sp. NPDC090010 TaxID=3363942 RepID=UPI00381359F2